MRCHQIGVGGGFGMRMSDSDNALVAAKAHKSEIPVGRERPRPFLLEKCTRQAHPIREPHIVQTGTLSNCVERFCKHELRRKRLTFVSKARGVFERA